MLLIILLAAYQAMTGKTLGQNVDGATSTADVQARLAADKLSNFTRIGTKRISKKREGWRALVIHGKTKPAQVWCIA